VRGAYCREHGPPEVVKVEELPTPALEPGQVLVRASAAAVNFPDVLIVSNDYQVKVPAPFVPGSEFAGAVAAVGEGVSGVEVGDRVFGTVFVGAFAEEVAVSASSVTRIPDGVDERLAAAFGVAHRTAYHVLRSVAQLQPGEELVVLGAGGGVGLAAVQLGAMPGGSDVVVDPVGGDLAEPALRSLRWDGRFVTVGYASGTIPRIPLNLVLLKGIHILGFDFRSFGEHRADEVVRNEAEIMELLATKRVAPHIGASFPLDDVVGAMRYVGDGKAVGKVVLDIGA
jgi:NADPH:quinone reductase